jgi:hypothetical protein
MTEIKLGIIKLKGRWHVLLRHNTGLEEISDQSWKTKAEVEIAVEQYIKDRGDQFDFDRIH